MSKHSIVLTINLARNSTGEYSLQLRAKHSDFIADEFINVDPEDVLNVSIGMGDSYMKYAWGSEYKLIGVDDFSSSKIYLIYQ